MPKQTITIDVPEGMRLVLAFEPEAPAKPATAPAPQDFAQSNARARKATPGLVSVVVPGNVPLKLPVEVEIDGQARVVAACVARVLSQCADGADRVQMRPETLAKLQLQVPELSVRRDPDRKIIGKVGWYYVDGVRACDTEGCPC